jgi:hypothetical protein
MLNLLTKKERLALMAGGLIASLALVTALFFAVAGLGKIGSWTPCQINYSATQTVNYCEANK